MLTSRLFCCLWVGIIPLLLGAAPLIAAEQDSQLGPDNPQTIQLSLQEAIQIALRNNTQTLLAIEQESEARAEYRQALAGVLPQLSGTVSQWRRTVSLTSLGFDPSFFPPGTGTVIGPFSSFDARVQVVQTLFDWGIFNNIAAGKTDVRLAQLQDNLAREQVANLAAVTYIQSLQADAHLKSAQEDLTLAQRLLRLTKDQFQVGVADEVDLARAKTQSAQNEASLIAARTGQLEALISLKRALMIPQEKSVRLTSKLAYTGYETMHMKQAVGIAESKRPEIGIAKGEVKKTQQLKQAAIGKQLPSIAVSANYGASGNSPVEDINGTYMFGGAMAVPIFDGGNTIAGISVAASQQRQAELNLRDMQQQVSEDVHLALEQLRNGDAQVRASKSALDLASREMQLARDQFAAGVGDNVQVVQAQDTLAEARDGYVQALAQFQTARINLATALGVMEDFEI